MHERRILSDHADIGAQAELGNVFDILFVDQYVSLLNVIKSEQQVYERGFARA